MKGEAFDILFENVFILQQTGVTLHSYGQMLL